MSDIQRGNTTHGPHMDDQLRHETEGLVNGVGDTHVEPFRQTEPLPDDTDDPDTERALDRDDQEGGGA